MMELRPFLKWSATLVLLPTNHQRKSHQLGEWKPTQRRRMNQKSHVKKQVNTRWLIFSSSWSQKGQKVGCGSPLRANRSAIQHISRATSNMKNSICQAHKFPKSYHKDWKLQYHETGFHRRTLLNIAHHQRTSNVSLPPLVEASLRRWDPKGSVQHLWL